MQGQRQARSPLRPHTLILLHLLLLSACQTGTATPTATSSPTSTIAIPSPTFEFPSPQPSITVTPEPTVSPTPDHLAGLGRVLYEDAFDLNRGWVLTKSEVGVTSLLQGRLVITLHEPEALHLSISPAGTLADFYAEVDVNGVLCHEDDEFGIVFRLNDASEHYRFAINCAGEARVSRHLLGESRNLIQPTSSPSIIAGPMVTNRLALMLSGDLFRFWINGLELFEVRDRELAQGQLGLFARTRRERQATIAFDHFLVRGLTPLPTPTRTITP
jgi:hypothetical protein